MEKPVLTQAGCVASCPRRYPHEQHRWCGDCRAEYERWMVDQETIAALENRYREFSRIAPALELEWRAHLDEIAPLAPDLADTVVFDWSV
jgi:hypothetical protein